MIRAIRSILDRSIDEPAGCGFLSSLEIEAWLDGKLTPARLEAFGEHQVDGCCACALLAADLEVFHGVVSRGLIESERREYEQTQAILKAHLRQKLERLDATVAARSSRFSWRYAWGAAAAVLLLAVVAVPILRDGSGEDGSTGTTMIGGVSLQPMPFAKPPEIRGAESRVELWNKAEAAYLAGDYTIAAEWLAEIAERGDAPHDALLYRGVALLMTGRHEQAVEVLQRSRKLAEEELGLQGGADDWWLGVAAASAGDTTLAREALERVRDAGGENAERAETMLKELGGG